MRGIRWSIIAALTAALSLVAGTAAADPPAGVVPATTDIVAAGSETTQSLFDQFSTDYNATTPAHKFYNFDATGSPLIKAKNDPSCGNFTTTLERPDGANASIFALNANAQAADGNFCLDIASSDRGITAFDGPVTSVLIAVDGITYATTALSNGVSGLSLTQLQSIYDCTATRWNDPTIGGTSGDLIVPILPQGNSGTRATFLQRINVTAPGSCVVNADGTQPIQENEGTNNIFLTGVAPNGWQYNTFDEIYPYSIGNYISQVDKHTSADAHGNLVLNNITGNISRNPRKPVIINEPPVINPNTANASINTSFPIQDGLFAVIRSTGDPANPVPSYLRALLGNNDNTGWVCSNATAQADVTNLGFLNIASCGLTTTIQ